MACTPMLAFGNYTYTGEGEALEDLTSFNPRMEVLDLEEWFAHFSFLVRILKFFFLTADSRR